MSNEDVYEWMSMLDVSNGCISITNLTDNYFYSKIVQNGKDAKFSLVSIVLILIILLILEI
jgi:hypothetical protein